MSSTLCQTGIGGACRSANSRSIRPLVSSRPACPGAAIGYGILRAFDSMPKNNPLWCTNMVLAKVLSSTLLGVDAHCVEVEVDLANGLPMFTTVGLPDASVRESRDRVKAAMANCGFPFPLRRITVNLAPAHLRKAGTAFDLPIALGVLQAAGYIQSEMLARYQVVGELSLDGRVKAVAGAPADGGRGAGIGRGRHGGAASRTPPRRRWSKAVPVFGVETLAQAIGFFNGTESLPHTVSDVNALFEKKAVYAEGPGRRQRPAARQARPGSRRCRRPTTCY